jgi:hypothetical protein
MRRLRLLFAALSGGLKIPICSRFYNKHLLAQRLHTLQPALYRSLLPKRKRRRAWLVASAGRIARRARYSRLDGKDYEEFEKELSMSG